MFSLLFKELTFYILFVVTAAGVVLCGSPKKQPRTSSIVQFIFFVWSFEISGNILKNQNFLYVLNRCSFFEPIWIDISLFIGCLVEIRNYSILSLAFIVSLFRVTEENLVFETAQSGKYSSFECFLCSLRN